MTRRARLGLLLVAGAGAAAALPRPVPLQTAQEGWEEIRWPFPRDAWPAGRAFRCGGAGCGGPVEVYVRPKVGFCNCATGVTAMPRWTGSATST